MVTADGIMDSLAKTARAKISKFETDLANTPSTAALHRRASGAWSQERKKLHKKIIRKFFTEDDALIRALPAAGEQPTFVTFGGRGGSGPTPTSRHAWQNCFRATSGSTGRQWTSMQASARQMAGW